MTEKKPAPPVPLIDQIAAVRRALMKMENSYPRLVKECEMTQERADKEIARFRAALETLMAYKLREDAITRGMIGAMNAEADERERKAGVIPLTTGRETAPYGNNEHG